MENKKNVLEGEVQTFLEERSTLVRTRAKRVRILEEADALLFTKELPPGTRMIRANNFSRVIIECKAPQAVVLPDRAACLTTTVSK